MKTLAVVYIGQAICYPLICFALNIPFTITGYFMAVALSLTVEMSGVLKPKQSKELS